MIYSNQIIIFRKKIKILVPPIRWNKGRLFKPFWVTQKIENNVFLDEMKKAFDTITKDMEKFFVPNYIGFGSPCTRDYIINNTPPHIRLALNYVRKSKKK
jgi:hypothetical protein